MAGEKESLDFELPGTSLYSTLTPRSFLAELNLTSQDPPLQGVCGGGVIIALSSSTSPPEPRVLLIKRTPAPGAPVGKWECPKGAIEDSDRNVVEGAAREIREETGLRVSRFVAALRRRRFVTLNQRLHIGSCVFVVEVKECSPGGYDLEGEGIDLAQVPVKLDPEEHTDFVWAREEDLSTEGEWPLMVPELIEEIRDAMVVFRGEKPKDLVW